MIAELIVIVGTWRAIIPMSFSLAGLSRIMLVYGE